VAAGAGASFAMACDIAIASPNASFIQAFAKIGLVLRLGGSWFLVERLGLARAMALVMTGDKLMAAQAKEWGLIWDVTEDFWRFLQPWQKDWPPCQPRHWLHPDIFYAMQVRKVLHQQLDIERDTQSTLGKTHDYIEGVTAFLEKRSPVFTGH
jgi:2-(1,2-epoxy-1,2-dihydrophenyl)acetyl-CoA isomerase